MSCNILWGKLTPTKRFSSEPAVLSELAERIEEEMETNKGTKDKSGKPLRVGDSIRLLSLDLSMFAYLTEEEITDIKSMIGESFQIEEIDENGDAWITRIWDRGDGEFESHSLRLAPAEMEQVSCGKSE